MVNSIESLDVGGGLRIVVDDSLCIVIEADRMMPPRTERFTVTNVKALVAGLLRAQEIITQTA